MPKGQSNGDALMTAVLQMDATTRAAFIKTCQVIQNALVVPGPKPTKASPTDVFGAAPPIPKKRGRPKKEKPAPVEA